MAKQRRTDGRDNPKKKRTDGKPDDPMYPLLPNAPAGQRPKGGINEMFNPPAQNPPGQAPGVRKKGPLLKGLAFTPTPEPAPMLGLTDAARARQGAPLPEQRRVPASETQYLNMSPEQRTQENLRRRGMSPQEISQFNEGVANREPLQVPRNIPANMPSAPPQPQLPMSPAAGAPQPQQEMVGPQEIAGPPPTLPMSPVAPMQPPTNQYGQPVRGVLTPERAPEDPNRVMEQFGRGSPEHIQALQAQMRTQQVAVSRPEDMADPRLDRLPTREQYEMDLTRRRYGEEAIDKRAGELRGEARFRTQADAVRLAGREALDQRRQDRGMLSFEDRDKKRQGIQDRQQEMFEERRGTRRDERQARRQEDIDRRTAAEMGIPYGEYLQQKEAMDLEKFRAESERKAALGTIAAQREATTTGAQTEVDVATLRSDSERYIARLDAGTRKELAQINAGISDKDRELAREQMEGQQWLGEFQANIQSARNMNEMRLALYEVTLNQRLTKRDVMALVPDLVNGGALPEAAGFMAADIANTAAEVAGEPAEPPTLVEPTAPARPAPTTGMGEQASVMGEPNMVPTEGVQQEQPVGYVPPTSRPRRAERTEPTIADPSEDISSRAIGSWLEPTRNIPNSFFGIGGVAREAIPEMKSHVVGMVDTADEIARLSETEPQKASQAARDILAAMTEGDNWGSDSTAGFGQPREATEMALGKKAYVDHFIDFAEGNFDRWSNNRYVNTGDDPFFNFLSVLDLNTIRSKEAFRRVRRTQR